MDAEFLHIKSLCHERPIRMTYKQMGKRVSRCLKKQVGVGERTSQSLCETLRGKHVARVTLSPIDIRTSTQREIISCK